jgi:hypothetical protein
VFFRNIKPQECQLEDKNGTAIAYEQFFAATPCLVPALLLWERKSDGMYLHVGSVPAADTPVGHSRYAWVTARSRKS